MTSLPIPFITALLLLLLAGSNHQQLKATATGRVFALFLYVNALAMVCIGFRWSHGLIYLLPIAAILSVVSASLLYLAFRSLGRDGPVIDFSRDWPHVIPIVLIILTLLIEPRWIEFLLIAIKLVFAVLLVLLAKQAPSSLQLVRLSWFRNSQQALWGAALLLLLSAGVDLFISIDFALNDGQNAAKMVGAANLIVVCLLGWASVMAGRGKGVNVQSTQSTILNNSAELVAHDVTETPATTRTATVATAAVNAKTENALATNIDDTSENDAQLLKQLNHLLIEQRLYADTELNLQKLARKIGVPARSVSRAINSQTGKNVSQWVNAARVDAVCDQLKNKHVSVTQAMHDAGFLTKSNFNREFRRLKGCSPSQWREDH